MIEPARDSRRSQGDHGDQLTWLVLSRPTPMTYMPFAAQDMLGARTGIYHFCAE